MIDLVFWSFVVAVLPMLLALGGSMITGAAGVLARPVGPIPGSRPDRRHFAPATPYTFGHPHLDRFGSRFHDL